MVKAKPDCVGDRFGMLIVTAKIPREYGKTRTLWRLRCDCGSEFAATRDRFDGRTETPSCGCYKLARCRQMGRSKRSPDCTGKRFGMLTAIGLSEIRVRGELSWELQCDCKNIIYRVRGDFDKRLGIKSCGCSSTALKKKNAGLRTEDLTGRSFGDLVVLKTVRGWNTESDRIRSSNECKCNCGTIVWRTSSQLKQSKFLNCRGPMHLVGPKYPPMPSPMPDRVGMLMIKYWHFAECQSYTNVRQDIQDTRISKLERASWIICFKEWSGENLSEQYIRNFILKWMRFAGKSVVLRSIQLRDGLYNNKRKRKLTGGEMTNSTSYYDAVHGEPKTQQEILLPKKRSFLRR